MKRIAIIMIILTMLVSMAAAEDLTKLSDAELADLNHRVQLEIFSRSITGEAGVIVPAGEYYVGVDIPAGRYEVSVADDVSFSEICIYHAVPLVQGIPDDTILIGTISGLSQRAVITLVDGDRITMYAHNAQFKVFAGLF